MTNMYQGAPADKGGLLPGDFVTQVNQVNIADTNALIRTVGDPSRRPRLQFSSSATASG